jgi:methionine-rich copper-binding protein CopC
MKKLFLALLSIALFSSTSAYAAKAQLVKSTPAEGSVNATPPSAFVLEFTEAVKLHQVYIKKDNDREVPLSNLSAKTAKTTTIPAPSLTAGHYVLEWSVFTQESTVLRGRIRFTVSTEGVAALASPH